MNRHKIWLKTFNPDLDFVCGKPLATIAGRQFKNGELIDKESIPQRRLRQLYERRTIVPKIDSEKPVLEEIKPDNKPDNKPETDSQETVLKELKPDIKPDIKPEAKSAKIVGPVQGGWFKVMDGEDQIGSSTRDKAEAEDILLEWLIENGE